MTAIKRCPECGLPVEVSPAGEPMCTPVTCTAWDVVQHFDYGTRQWQPGDYPAKNGSKEVTP